MLSVLSIHSNCTDQSRAVQPHASGVNQPCNIRLPDLKKIYLQTLNQPHFKWGWSKGGQSGCGANSVRGQKQAIHRVQRSVIRNPQSNEVRSK